MSEGNEARILLVEDDIRAGRAWHRIFRRTGFLLDVTPSLSAARTALGTHSYRMVFVDLLLDDGYGATLLPALAALEPRPIVAVISGHLDCERIIALYGHCDITVPKPIAPRVLMSLVSPLIARNVPEDTIAQFCRRHDLSPREAQVVQVSARGGDNRHIAAMLGCRPGTLKTFWQRIFRKTKQRSQGAVLAAAVRFEVLRRAS